MNAIVVEKAGGPEVLQIKQVDTPVCEPGTILVKVHAAGINPVDTYLRSGDYPIAKFPFTPGFDAAGVIESISPNVKGFRLGDRVYTGFNISGAYAEYVLCHDHQVYALPDRVEFPEGACINVPYATAYKALYLKGHAKPGEYVLVHGGSGGVGVAAIQLARAGGFTVIATAGTDQGLNLINQCGAHHAFNHNSPSYVNDIKSLTADRGIDVILEMLANVNLEKDLGLLGMNGRVVVIGNRGRVEIDPRLTMGKELSITGMALFNASSSELRSIHSALKAGFDNGSLKPVIGHQLPLAEAARGHELVMKPGSYGKIVLKI
ncbi:MAG: NADPH:quinone reductase [Verrucomicrobiota bacterium]|nr:NADPH:quinone reductase [Verrucomicrobiota bacterium]